MGAGIFRSKTRPRMGLARPPEEEEEMRGSVEHSLIPTTSMTVPPVGFVVLDIIDIDVVCTRECWELCVGVAVRVKVTAGVGVSGRRLRVGG